VDAASAIILSCAPLAFISAQRRVAFSAGAFAKVGVKRDTDNLLKEAVSFYVIKKYTLKFLAPRNSSRARGEAC